MLESGRQTKMNNRNIITQDKAEIYVDQYNRTYFTNSRSGREIMMNDLISMGMNEELEAILAVWGNNPTVLDPDEIPKTLDQLKADKQNELNDAFNRAVEGSFTTTEGYKMQFNTDDSLKMFGAIQLLEGSGVESGYITDADDITHYDIPVATMKSVQNQMLNRYAQCHLLKQQYRALIEAASDEEALQDIEFEF